MASKKTWAIWISIILFYAISATVAFLSQKK
jgi:hypothetical protein